MSQRTQKDYIKSIICDYLQTYHISHVLRKSHTFWSQNVSSSCVKKCNQTSRISFCFISKFFYQYNSSQKVIKKAKTASWEDSKEFTSSINMWIYTWCIWRSKKRLTKCYFKLQWTKNFFSWISCYFPFSCTCSTVGLTLNMKRSGNAETGV